MDPSFLVINKVGTLRRLTVNILNNLGYTSIHDVEEISEAQQLIKEVNEPLIIILELSPSWSRTNEFEFLNFLKKSNEDKPVPVIITSEIEDQNLFAKFTQWGVKDFVIQTFMLSNFSSQIKNAIDNNSPMVLSG